MKINRMNNWGQTWGCELKFKFLIEIDYDQLLKIFQVFKRKKWKQIKQYLRPIRFNQF